jgi:penicillin G amidase
VESVNPMSPAEYQTEAGWERFRIVRDKVMVKGEAQPVEVELRYTRNGPVIHDDAKHHRAYALRWAGFEPGGAAYLNSLGLDRAGNWTEFLAALERWKIPALNMVYADLEGNIGWLAAGATPRRTSSDGLLPTPGASAPGQWAGFLSVRELPQVFNPRAGWVGTANHNILPAGYPHPISHEWSTPYRFERIKQRLDAKAKFDIEDCKSLQFDNVTIPGQLLARLAKGLQVDDAALRPNVELMAGWDGTLDRESAAGALYGAWLQELQRALFSQHVPEHLLTFVSGRQGIAVLMKALEKPDTFWFGKDPVAGRDRVLRETLAAAAARVRKSLGDNPARWKWGDLHRISFRHPLSGLSGEHTRAFDPGPVGMPGDAHTPNAASHTRDFAMTIGASYRQVFDLADWDRGWATSAPGQSGQPASPHYADLLPLWAKSEYFPLAFTRAKVEAVTRHRLMLKPAPK